MIGVRGAHARTESGFTLIEVVVVTAVLSIVFAVAGIALLVSAYYQGRCLASSINASKSEPEVFGLSIAPAAIIEGFAVFAFVFALVLAGALPPVQAG